MLQILYLMLVTTSVLSVKFSCNHESAVNVFKRPTYDFSVQLLDRVAQETGHHFVFSPLSTWLQLMTLAEGARGSTENEIRKVTRYHRMKCFRRKYREVLNGLDDELSFMSKHTNVIILDKLLDVKDSYKNEAKRSDATKVLTLDFNDPEKAAAKANDIIQMDMDGVINEGIHAEDFNLTVLLMTETAYFKNVWRTPFNPVYTSTEPFYSKDNAPIGKVRLMTQTGYFNVTDVPFVDSKVLELPFNTDGRISMLVFLPKDDTVKNVFYKLKDTRLATIFALFEKEGTKLMNVRIPRFQIKTSVENIPELVFDMGVKRIFYPELADFGGISNYKMYTSLMTQVADIEINEEGATARVMAEFLIIGANEEFVANKPFAYLIIDRKTDVILFGGIYSNPSIY